MCDSGILHGLLELETLDDLFGHPVCGLGFEAHCIENLVLAAGPRRVPYFCRTQVGAEIDLLLEKGGQSDLAIEITRSSAPTPAKGYAQACDDLRITQRYVVSGRKAQNTLFISMLQYSLTGGGCHAKAICSWI